MTGIQIIPPDAVLKKKFCRCSVKIVAFQLRFVQFLGRELPQSLTGLVGAVHEQLIFCHGQEQGHLHCPVIFISSAVKHIVVVVAVLKAFPVKAADLGTCLGKKEQPHGSQDAEIEKDTASYAGAGIVVPSGGGKDQCQDKQRQR